MTLTNYQKVVDFNVKFGVPVFNTPQKNIFTENPKLVSLRFGLSAEETKELNQGVQNKDWVECIDALGDILYVDYGMGASFGVDMDESFKNFMTSTTSTGSYTHETESNWDRVQWRRIMTYKTNNKKPVLYIFDETNSFNKEMYSLLNKINEHLGLIEQDIKSQNFDSLIDNLNYHIFYTYQLGALMGCDMNKAFGLIHDSNMSKLCSTEQEAQQTVEWYKERPELGYAQPAYRKGEDGDYWVVYNAATGKILKSINYHPVDLKPLTFILADEA